MEKIPGPRNFKPNIPFMSSSLDAFKGKKAALSEKKPPFAFALVERLLFTTRKM